MKKREIINFSDKYTKTNFITKKIIDNFFSNIDNLTQGVEVNKIFEVGCGLGFSTQYLSKMFKNKLFEASDYELSCVKSAQLKNPEVRIIQESIYKLKRADNNFDLIICLEVLEHLQNPEYALKELKRVTSNYCILSVPREPVWKILNMARGKYWNNFANTPGHINHWSKADFIKFLKNDFKILKIATPLPWTIALLQI